ncbi:hypothetical protein HNR42_000091 [Deinobacterium chartae]|uniref:Uncharacterized protein n=1 Tax=Deinobacterium chartae TaxID=521158 RepID=A0A841HWQ5_9DEIO|nr:DUF5682 family protein [Deinobacterium chartae]MBB6096679.1 hypothetical protein [Deinobacterium chartae]
MAAELHLFGIRHHGPGSGRTLGAALRELQPDVLLIEGPPEASGVLELAAHPDMKPPVALLLYAQDDPSRAVHYPFAAFSPEWVALRYAATQAVPVRFIDLPAASFLTPPAEGEEDGLPADGDPLGWLARAAGYPDGERWWDHLVESRGDGENTFAAVLEAMRVLREHAGPAQGREARREAQMRQEIRRARKDGFGRIAVVCGAWHAPALEDLSGSREDAALLKNLPKLKVRATWVPWTHDRLSVSSGYGAGVPAPGWYAHLWNFPEHTVPRWFVRVAHLLREEGFDASSAHVLEAVRLAEGLAALRGRALPDLEELEEAARAVFSPDSELPLNLIRRRLTVGEDLGAVPAETPTTPLQGDLERESRRLRLKPEAFARDLDLDLRKDTDLARSRLLHRLNLLGVPWGEFEGGGGRGTFRERWTLRWQPEFSVRLVEASALGATVRAASTARLDRLAAEAELVELTGLLDQALLADLANSVPGLLRRLEDEAARNGDAARLLAALPPLTRVVRYGDVRGTDVSAAASVARHLAVRAALALPNATASLDDGASRELLGHVNAAHDALRTLEDPEVGAAWRRALGSVCGLEPAHGLLRGRSVRLLLELGALDAPEAGRRLEVALSRAADPAQAAAWIEGFASGSGLLLVHDPVLWELLDRWVSAMAPEAFDTVLPLLRRTFSTFAAPERRALGERARQRTAPQATSAGLEETRARAVLPALRALLGLEEAAP